MQGRQLWTGRALLALAAVAGSASALAQGHLDNTVKLVLGFSLGGTTDVLARLIAGKLCEKKGQQFIVDNGAGASDMIGTDAVAKLSSDGYTLLFTSSTLATYRALYPRTPFDPVRDFSPVGMVSTTPSLLVVPYKLPVKTWTKLVEYAKAHPDELNYAASGPGGGQNLAWEMCKRNTKTDRSTRPTRA